MPKNGAERGPRLCRGSFRNASVVGFCSFDPSPSGGGGGIGGGGEKRTGRGGPPPEGGGGP
ncbi:MAG: hypothetical protein F4Z61_02595, partial [Acidimicrobiia bacterium]|nr:hypothetical protein [Acidimicrobiia bacterium]